MKDWDHQLKIDILVSRLCDVLSILSSHKCTTGQLYHLWLGEDMALVKGTAIVSCIWWNLEKHFFIILCKTISIPCMKSDSFYSSTINVKSILLRSFSPRLIPLLMLITWEAAFGVFVWIFQVWSKMLFSICDLLTIPKIADWQLEVNCNMVNIIQLLAATWNKSSFIQQFLNSRVSAWFTWCVFMCCNTQKALNLTSATLRHFIWSLQSLRMLHILCWSWNNWGGGSVAKRLACWTQV